MYRHFERLVGAVARAGAGSGRGSGGLKLNLTTNGSFLPGPTGRTPQARR